MTVLNFSTPQNFAVSFEVPVDHSAWNGQYERNTNGTSPVRDRILTVGNALIPKPNCMLAGQKVCGIYLLTFELPYKAFYVGIAAGDGQAPEGILSRLRKHRIKATGSNGGIGVHHPRQWRKFALDRFNYFQSKKNQTLVQMQSLLLEQLMVMLCKKYKF
jgi:hypothetical protein